MNYTIYEKIKREIKNNPHICCICGAVETMDNLILLYDKGYICDACLPKAYPELENENGL